MCIRDRCKTIEAAGTNAHRLASGPGGWVERLGDDVILSYKSDDARDLLAAGLATWRTGCQPEFVHQVASPAASKSRASSLL